LLPALSKVSALPATKLSGRNRYAVYVTGGQKWGRVRTEKGGLS